MKYCYLFCLFVGITLSLSAQPVLVDKVVAVVGDNMILKSDIEVQYQQYAAEGSVPPGLRCQIMDQMLAQKLLIAQAELDSIVVDDGEVEGELDKRIRHFIGMIGSQEKLEEFYEKSVIEIKEEFRPDVRNQLIAQKMQGEITSGISVTPAEVKDFFQRIPEDSLPRYNAEVEVGQVVIYPKPSEESKRMALAEIRNLRTEIVNGADFKLKAILYSDDPGSASKGGELPEFSKDDPFAPEFINVSFRLQDGEISQPFETDFGYHIVQMIKRSGDRVLVRHILIIPEVSNSDVRQAKALSDSILNLLQTDQISFGQAVTRFSEDEGTNKYGGMLTNPNTGESRFELDELGAMDQTIPFVIDTMETGEFSNVHMYADYRGNQAYRILFLKSVTDPHVANLEQDYARIMAAALSRKKAEAMKNWLESRIQRTYISIDPSFAECPELEPWITARP